MPLNTYSFIHSFKHHLSNFVGWDNKTIENYNQFNISQDIATLAEYLSVNPSLHFRCERIDPGGSVDVYSSW